MRYTTYFLFMVLMLGCKAINPQGSGTENLEGLSLAAAYMQQGELYRARKATQDHLDLNPGSAAGEAMMAHILNREISRHKQLYEDSVPEEWSGKDREQETRTWIERSKTLLKVKQHERALDAAEKVFTYDPKNIEASNLVDEIRVQAIKDGKTETLAHTSMIQQEVDQRILRYRDRAQKRTEAGKLGEAKLLVQKLLMLSPGDPIGKELQDRIHLLQQGNIR